jgi:hypothetical protein
MEPANLNTAPDDDARLIAMLRETTPALPDHGFSQRVMTSLPPKTHVSVFHLRLLLSLLGAIAGLWFALQNGLSVTSLKLAADQLTESFVPSGTMSGTHVLVALAVALLSLLYAFRNDSRLSPKF